MRTDENVEIFEHPYEQQTTGSEQYINLETSSIDIEDVTVTNEQFYKDINDTFNIPNSDEDISFEDEATNDYKEQVTNDNEEQKQNVVDDTDDEIDSSDNEDFETKDEAQMLLTQLLKDIKNKFGSKEAKNMVFTSCKEANIELISNTERNSPSCVDNISINFFKEKVTSFTEATLDLKIDLIPNKNTEAILQNCTRVYKKIKEFDATKAVAQVAMFAFFSKDVRFNERSPKITRG
ncbi:hypothetical protein INT46_003995 [Mucor plumbeus]|uniref:Uncharacterized protein n=1 Tax=Mucor plumbeus TaxID=97098 RepID=A0A8H7QCW8_9FUNG|nr:hypothetical protein INT46_003995 [Mucor plumbeus]